MSDQDLEDLRREVARAPDEAAARLRLGVALARAGLRDEAVEALFLARALGAVEAGAHLRALGAPASPWAHALWGDGRRSLMAPVRGPRRGEVVARADVAGLQTWPSIAILEDGTVVLSGQLAFDGRTLAAKGAAPPPPPGGAVAFDGRAARVVGTDRVEVRARDGSLVAEGPLELPAGAGADALVFDGEELVVTFDGARSRSEEERPYGLLWLRLDGRRIVTTARSVGSLSGLSSRVGGPALGPDGRVFVVTAYVYMFNLYSHGLTVWDRGQQAWTASPGDEESELLGGQPPAFTAADRGGGCWVAVDGVLHRYGPDGALRWKQPASSAWWERGLVVDREDVAYTADAAYSDAGEPLFRLDGRPLAIDGFGRLLAVRAEGHAAKELVAIA